MESLGVLLSGCVESTSGSCGGTNFMVFKIPVEKDGNKSLFKKTFMYVKLEKLPQFGRWGGKT